MLLPTDRDPNAEFLDLPIVNLDSEFSGWQNLLRPVNELCYRKYMEDFVKDPSTKDEPFWQIVTDFYRQAAPL